MRIELKLDPAYFDGRFTSRGIEWGKWDMIVDDHKIYGEPRDVWKAFLTLLKEDITPTELYTQFFNTHHKDAKLITRK